MYSSITRSEPCQTKEKSWQTWNIKEPAQIHKLFPLMESEAVVIGGKNLTYISKLATSQKKKKSNLSTSTTVC